MARPRRCQSSDERKVVRLGNAINDYDAISFLNGFVVNKKSAIFVTFFEVLGKAQEEHDITEKRF